MKFDVLVLGAGMVGVATALQLQRRGIKVALVDKHAPGSGTSFGNAGLIQREAVYPHAFPRDLPTMLRYAGNRSMPMRYHPLALPKLSGFLLEYWRNSRPDRLARIAQSYSTLIELSVSEHRELVNAAQAQALLRRTGWMKVFRTQAAMDQNVAKAARIESEYGYGYGYGFDALDAQALGKAEPSLSRKLIGGLLYTTSDTVSDPQGLVLAYAALFKQLGGTLFVGDAASLKPGWSVDTSVGTVDATTAVVAMGPWAGDLTRKLGYRIPLAPMRGYHMHYGSSAGASLNHPIHDSEIGYMLSPMARGIRINTGVELANRDAAKTPAQLDSAEGFAREIYPLGERLDAEPWVGSRPCMPDMLPVIGSAHLHRNLWFAIGHGHHGMTLGAVTGRLIAEVLSGHTPAVDLQPFRVDRF